MKTIKKITQTLTVSLMTLLLIFTTMSFTNQQNSETPGDLVINSTGTISVQIKGMNADKGNIIIGLYSKSEGFPDYDKSFKSGSVKSSSGGVSYTFENIPEGEYGIAVWQDENGNKELDKNLFGVPKEKYGFSNNKFGKMGPPDFNDVKFKVTVDNKTSLTINLK